MPNLNRKNKHTYNVTTNTVKKKCKSKYVICAHEIPGDAKFCQSTVIPGSFVSAAQTGNSFQCGLEEVPAVRVDFGSP